MLLDGFLFFDGYAFRIVNKLLKFGMLLGLSEDQGKNSIVSVGKQGHCRDKDGLEGQNQSRLMLLPREFFSGALGIVHIVPLPRIFLYNPYLI